MEFGPILRSLARNKFRFGLIVIEVALTLAIVSNCVAMILEARRRMAQPSGFDDDNLISVLSTPFAAQEQGYFDNQLLEDQRTLRALSGVRGVLNTEFVPWRELGGDTSVRPILRNGSHSEQRSAYLRTQVAIVGDGLVDTLGIELSEGREFTREEAETDTRRVRELQASVREMTPQGPAQRFVASVLVTQAFAELAFGPGPYVGREFEDWEGDIARVIGVVKHFHKPSHWPITNYAIFYTSWSGNYGRGTPFLVRADPGSAPELARRIESALLAKDDRRNLRVSLISDVKAEYLGPQRVLAFMMALIATLLVTITSLGIVGLTSFSVNERRRQIGVRRALGAQKQDILRYFLLENWLLTSLGLLLGLGLAAALNWALTTVASGARLHWQLVAGGAGLLWLTGLLAALVPALRGARTSPAIATRNV